MATYEYQCKDCGEEFEAIQSWNDPPHTICPVCKGTLEKLISAPHVYVKMGLSDIKTLGHLAARNTETMSDEEKHRLTEKHKTKRNRVELPPGMSYAEKPKDVKPPWWNKYATLPDKKVAKLTKEQTKKYVETGHV